MRDYYIYSEEDDSIDINDYYVAITQSETIHLAPSQYKEFGATVADSSLPLDIVITMNGGVVQEVDTSQAGAYTITYSATNNGGYTGTAVRTVEVSE